MKIWWSILLLGFWAAPGLAERLIVRSGEHDGFSRLVLRLPAGTTWSGNRQNEQYRLSVDLAGVVFDLAGVFDRIPRTRIRDLRQSGPGAPLTLYLNCDCTVVTTTSAAGSLLILDISGPPRAKATVAERRYRWARDPGSIGVQLPEEIGYIRRAQGNNNARPAYPIPAMRSDPPTSVLDRADLPMPDLGPVLNITEMRLLEQIGRATRQGLLSPKAGGHVEPQSSPMPEVAQTATPPAAASPRPRSSGLSQLVATTSADEANAQIAAGRASKPNACLPDAAVDVSNWAAKADFAAGLSALRGDLFSDTGSLNPEIARRMVRHYLHFGFGAEAKGILRISGSDPSSIEWRLALLIDSDLPEGTGDFADQSDCRSDIAMWSLLAAESSGPAMSTDTVDAILRAFTRLPGPLRAHLGPRISSRLLNRGHPEAAAAILRAVDPGSAGQSAETRMAQAQIDLHQGQVSEAEAGLSSLIAEGAAQTPQALVALVDELAARGAVPQPGLAALVETYASQARGTDLGESLQRASALALSLQGDFASAFAKTRKLKDATSVSFAETYKQVFARLTDRADDVTFLARTLDEASMPPPDLDVPTGNRIATRLLNLGFPATAKIFLEKPMIARRSPERRMMRARIALATDMRQEALNELIGLDSVEANKLRAEALAGTGDFEGAAQAFDVALDPSGAARAAWMANPGQVQAAQDAGDFAEVVSLSHDLLADNPLPGPDTPLTQARALLDEATVTRDGVDGLLALLPSPAPSAE